MTAGWSGMISGANESYARPVYIRVCGSCDRPTFFPMTGESLPSRMPGQAVPSAPGDVGVLYEEARRATAAGAYTSAVMACRKILLHVAVEQGAKDPKNFAECVEWLLSHGYLPANARPWLDYIRRLGNEANHEIVTSSKEQAERVLGLTEHLLRTIYALPKMLPEG
jgi:hypothetical protein